MNPPVQSVPPVSVAEKRAKLANRLRAASATASARPLSFAQTRLWFLDQLEPNSPLYNVPAAIRLTGALNSTALEAAFRVIIARHESLRTRFDSAGETPMQVVNNEFDFKLTVVNAGSLAEAEKWIREEVRRPFNLASSEPLLRASLARLNGRDHLLGLNLHHIAADEWSLEVLFRELEEAYAAQLEGRNARLPDLPVQYSDFAAWQRKQLTEDWMQDQLRYWKGKLADAPPVTELMTDRARGRVPTFQGRTLNRTLSADLGAHLDTATFHDRRIPSPHPVRRGIGRGEPISLAVSKGADLAPLLKQFAADKDVTLYMLLLAAFNVLIHRYTGLEEVIVGTPVAGRNRMETEALIGFFVNTLPLRTKLAGDPAFEDLLRQVRAVALEAYSHQDLPFEKIVEELRPDRSQSHLVFTNIMFALQTRVNATLSLRDLKTEWLDVDTGTSKFDVTFVVQDFGDRLVARVEYNSDLFSEATMERLLGHFENLLHGIVANPSRRISELPMLAEAERHQLLVEWNDNKTDYPRDLCIHQLFEAQVAERPEAAAVVFDGETLTYHELNARANQLAHFLRRQGLERGAPVAVCMERCAEMVVGFLAILKAGGAYVPLDPRCPKERLEFMMSDTRASLVLTTRRFASLLPRRAAKILSLEKEQREIAKESAENPPNVSAPEDVAYIIYTSGSTGVPKGVAVPHRAVNRLVLRTNYIQLDNSDRIAQVSNIAFDAATFEIWGALLNGGQLRKIASDVALSPADFARELSQEGITAMFLTSALFSQVAAELPGAFATLRTLIAGGDALEPKAVRAVLKACPQLRLVNGYGPTENTTFTCCNLLRDVPENATNIPIGRPISNTRVYILDSHRNPVPIGVPGELYAGGDGLARGYWNRPELTAEKFILHQFTADGPCHCLYRTGDLARYLPDGNIEFLGRIDDQVKIRGFRVELGEIEAVLGRYAEVRECAVIVNGVRAGEKRLIAYVVPDRKRPPKSDQLRKYLSAHLPDYMVPSAFVQLESLPLTRNGKLDTQALPAPDHARPTLEKRYATPRDAIEVELTQIWESVLGVEPIGIEDHFFDLGGHSLLAVRVAARVEKAFGKKLPLAAIFQAPTVEKLAVLIRDSQRGDDTTTRTSVVEIQPKGARPPLFLVHGAGGGMFWGYTNLSKRLDPDQPVFGFGSRGLHGDSEFDTIEGMAAQYVNDLRVVQPVGPYYLGGYCFGGNVAYEMARQLQNQGEKVALLALLNCAPPNSDYMKARWTPQWCVRFVRNLFYWADYCRQWTPSQKREFARWKWSRLKNWFAQRFHASLAKSSSREVENLIDLSSLPVEQRDLWKAHICALMKFHPQPYSGRVHLIRSPGHPLWCSFDPNYGWADLAENGVNTSIVRGAHEKILEEPSVDETAAVLTKILEQTQEGDLEFWKRKLSGAPALLELPTDHPRPAMLCAATASESRSIDNPKFESMKEEDRSIAVLAALIVVLHKYSRYDDISIGLQIEPAPAAVHTSVLRANLSGDPTAREFLARLRAERSAATRHGKLPFKELVRELCPTPDRAYHPVVQVFFASDPPLPLEGFDLRLSIIDCKTKPAFRLEYATELYNQTTISRMLGHLETALRQVLTQPEQPISKLSILTPAELDIVLEQWNRTEMEYPKEKTLIQLFHEQVSRAPTAEALVCGRKRFTYEELSVRAARIAKHLRSLEVGRGSLVGVCLERSEDMVSAILGTLHAGAAYVPLDPAYPRERLEFVARHAGLKVLLTRRKFQDLCASPETVVLCVEDLESTDGGVVPDCASTSRDLAYVLYTSGSTGEPKGVAVEHRSAVALVSWAASVFTPGEISGTLASTSICFDLSIFELFVPLSCGGKIILADNALALPSLPAAGEVTLVNTVPSAIRELLRINGVPASVRVVNLAGEPLATALVDQIYNDTSVRKVYDLYGPTETTTYSTFVLRQPGEPPTIGRPLANETVYILDSKMQPVPIGIPGDLYIGGDGLARGYLNRPELTAERFLPNPFRAGDRIYKTGDLARWREDGNLVFLGRSDYQVKIRGFRVELGEIESALKAHANVADAIVIVREDRPGEKQLAAYVVTRSTGAVTFEELRLKVREKLPEYMMPATFTLLDQLPLTPNGKVDRRVLLEMPAGKRDGEKEVAPPLTELEKTVANVWAEVLGVDKVGVNDNFFDLGGHSLLAIQVISHLRTNLGFDLPFSCLFDAPTVRAFAAGLESNRWKSDGNQCPPLEPMPGDGQFPASFIQEQLWFLQQLDPASDAYNVPVAVRLKGKLDLKALQQAFDLIVRRHDVLRSSLRLSGGSLELTPETSPAIRMGIIEMPGGSEAQVIEAIQTEARRPFDLERGHLIRANVVRKNDSDCALVIVLHHAVSDAWSLDILFLELEVCYRAFALGESSPELPKMPVQYFDYARWRRRWMQGDVLKRELNYWREKLEGAPLMLNLPVDSVEVPQPARGAGRCVIEFSEAARDEIANAAKGANSTIFMVLMSALAITLKKWTGQSDMVIGTVVAGRNHPEIEGLIGCFMNFLPLRIKVPDSQTGLGIMRSVREEVIEGQTHQDCPFVKIVESVTVERRPGNNPLYNVALLFQDCPIVPQFGAGLESAPMPANVATPLLDLRFEANETKRGITLTCEYRTDKFLPKTVEHLMSSVRSVLRMLAQSPETKITDVNIDLVSRKPQVQQIVVAGTFTTDPIAEPLRFWLDELDIPSRIEFAPYDQVFQQLLDPASVLASNRAGLNVLLIRLADWDSTDFSSRAGISRVDKSIESRGDEFVMAVHSAAARGGAPILVCFCPSSPRVIGNAIRSQAFAKLESTLAKSVAQISGVHVATSAELSSLYPVADYDDPKGEELGHIPYTPIFFTALATMVARKLHALSRPPCKVVVLDCDQTLWSGVCGEDGPQGICIDPPRVALQQFMRRQMESGKLLALCSKNEEADVNAVFEEGPAMPLRRDHFSANRINWRPKSENLKSIAKELKLGLNSLVLIDDNPVECAEVQANCPEVLTLQLPEDLTLIPKFLEHCWVFDQLGTTDEDRSRTELYRQNQLREELQAKSMSLADFITGLALEVQIAPAEPAQMARVAQLTQRTNQFNVTGRKRTEAELRQLNGSHEILTTSVKDRFGDYGLVGVMIFEVRGECILLDSFLLSCRALGRGVEHRILAFLGNLARRRGAQWVDVPFKQSQRNQPAQDFLESVGRQFKQEFEDHVVFHLPAIHAEEVALNPARPTPSEPDGIKNLPEENLVIFHNCQKIAQNFSSIVKIHQTIEARLATRPAAKTSYTPPKTEMERNLCELWQKLLRIERVGVTDDFFDLGGHSLLAVRLFAEIDRMTGRKLPLVTLFQTPTIRQLAAVLGKNQTAESQSIIVPIQPHGNKPPLYLIHGAGGDVLWGYANLVAHMDPEQPIYALKSRGQTGMEEFEHLEEMAAFYVEAVKAAQPEGPYFLGGYCFGGNVAYEMARQIESKGGRVALLALLDSAPANAGYEKVKWWRPEFAWLFTRNLCYWLQDFRTVHPRDRRRFIARKFRSFGRKVASKLGRGSDSAKVDLEEVIDPAQFPENELKLWETHLSALGAHVQQPYPGRVTLFRTHGHPLFSSYSSDLCWGSLARGGVSIKLIPGSHENFFMEPNVKSLASALTAALSETQAGATRDLESNIFSV